jgi:MFS family permease
MVQPLFYGWYIVMVCFLIALFGWGLGFYGTGIYLVALRAQHGWPTSFIASAFTVYYLLSSILIVFIGDALERFGPRRVVLLGSTAMGLGVVGLATITAPWQIYAPLLAMAVGWAAMSSAALTTIIAPWFDRQRGLAVSLALNGASCGGMVMVPLLLFLITQHGFLRGVSLATGIMLLVLVPSIMLVLRRHPHALGLWPDGARPEGARHPQAALNPISQAFPWQRTTALRYGNFWTIAMPFTLALVAQVGFLTHQLAYLTPLMGVTTAGFTVSMTAVAAVLGRSVTGVCIDRLPRRLIASVTFLLQACALTILLAFPTPVMAAIACVLFGFGVGNVVSLPGILVQHEFPPQAFGRIVSVLAASSLFVSAFGPGSLGVLRDVTGNYHASLLLCILLQGLAAGMVLLQPRPALAPAVLQQGSVGLISRFASFAGSLLAPPHRGKPHMRRQHMLQLRPNCECCNTDLPPDSPQALICSFECTFCAACATQVLHGRCPNCGGELVRRPMRPADKLLQYPAATERIFKAQGCVEIA